MTTTTTERLPQYTVIHGPTVDAYQEKVVHTYAEDPAAWQKALGDTLQFQWGIYDHPASPRPVGLGEAGLRYFDRQLELAGLTGPQRPPLRRILDLGCGWGYLMGYLADLFPECPRIDGLNISRRQLEHCAGQLAHRGLNGRANLYLCNARDLSLLPDRADLFDLVVIRGVITHFSPELYQTCVAALSERVASGGVVVISDNLYTTDLSEYASAIPDDVDHSLADTAKLRTISPPCCRHTISPSRMCGCCPRTPMSHTGCSKYAATSKPHSRTV